MSGAWNTNLRPSSAAVKLMSPFSPPARSGTSRIMSSARITSRNVAALSAYTHATPRLPMMSPPSAGPSTDAVWNMIALRLMALARCSRGTRLGTRDCRAGASNELNADVIAVSR